MLRFLTCAVAAALIIGLLFTALDFAISMGHQAVASEPPARIEFTSLMRATKIEPKKRFKPAPREKPKIDSSAIALATTTSQARANSPLKMDVSSSLLGNGGEGGVEAGGVTAGDVKARGRFVGGRSDRGMMPLVRVEPDYPESASRQGLEGWVVVEFTVTSSGVVKDPRVLHAEPQRIFDQAAMKSVLRWRYSPQVENGVPVDKQARVKIVFQLPKGGRS